MSYSLPTVIAPDGASVRVTIASTPDQIEQGLMGVRSLRYGTGMLFMFDRDSDGAFWMKNTHVPLDIVFIDSSWRVGSVRHGSPMSESPIVPAMPYRFVLEVPLGWCRAHGVVAGTRLSISGV